MCCRGVGFATRTRPAEPVGSARHSRPAMWRPQGPLEGSASGVPTRGGAEPWKQGWCSAADGAAPPDRARCVCGGGVERRMDDGAARYVGGGQGSCTGRQRQRPAFAVHRSGRGRKGEHVVGLRRLKPAHTTAREEPLTARSRSSDAPGRTAQPGHVLERLHALADSSHCGYRCIAECLRGGVLSGQPGPLSVQHLCSSSQLARSGWTKRVPQVQIKALLFSRVC